MKNRIHSAYIAGLLALTGLACWLSAEWLNPIYKAKLAAVQSAVNPAMLVQTCVSVVTSHGSGSGTLLESAGDVYVLTAAHVVNGETEGIKLFQDSLDVPFRRFASTATLVRVFDAEDVAILHVSTPATLPGRRYAQVASITPTAIGSTLYHVGSFLGPIGSQSFSRGYLAKLLRISPLRQGQPRFQYSGPAYPGSSGGGVFNTEGKLVGTVVEAAGADMIYCVPIEVIIEVARREGLLEIVR